MKIVTSDEMEKIESFAYSKGESEIGFMEAAGKQVANQVEQFIDRNGLEPSIFLLVGKGNNGGDAYAAGKELLQKGFSVVAYPIAEEGVCSPLCKQMRCSFQLQGGKIEEDSREPFPLEGVIVDGLVGTGFRGAAEGNLAVMIRKANASELPIISIDIPSGVCGNTGKVATVAIDASMTIYLGLPKIGCLIGDGWNHTGEFIYAYFGLKPEYIDRAKPFAYLINLDSLSPLMPKMKRNRHKYQAGYVLGVAGSYEMPGAALLSGIAALKAGAGVSRLFHPKGMEEMLNFSPYELIKEGWDFVRFKRIEEEMQRAGAFFIGPGLG
ncbi:MAG: NAD(P)H-hydrate epimerase, partial [Chlamydiales bacterium]|nr:NAD(P)H-hydrate epimerase [Chlamydiales bacterium]